MTTPPPAGPDPRDPTEPAFGAPPPPGYPPPSPGPAYPPHSPGPAYPPPGQPYPGQAPPAQPYPGQPGQAYPGQAYPGPAHSYPPPASTPYPPAPAGPGHPGGYTPPPVRRKSGTLVRVLAVVAVLALCACGGAFMVLKPRWDQYQFVQEFHALDFSMFGFRALDDPQYQNAPDRVFQNFTSIDDLVEEEPSFAELALDHLYSWARDRGSNASEEEFAECFVQSCRIGWPYGDDRQIWVNMGPDTLSEDPKWDVGIHLEPR